MKFLVNKSNLIIAVLLLALIPFLISHKLLYVHIIILIMLFASLGQALNIVAGYAGQLSLGHSAFFGLGAYTSTLLFVNYNISPWFGMIMGGIVAAIVSIGIGYPCFRLRGPFFTLSTIAVAEIIRMLAIYFKSVTKGAVGIAIPLQFGFANFVFRGKLAYFYICLILFVITTLISWWISESSFGRKLTAIREDEDTALSVGISVKWCKLKAMMVSAFLTAIFGTFYAQYVLFIEPVSEFSLDLSLSIAMILILGGYGRVSGPIVGAALLIPVQEFTRSWLGGGFQGLHFVIYGIILMVVAILLPEGIVGKCLKLLGDIIPKEEISFEVGRKPNLKFADYQSFSQNGYLLDVRNLWKHFGGLTAVKAVDFNIKEGEIAAIIGPNGAGKTTIFNLLSGFYKPDDGSIIFVNKDITGLSADKRACMGLGRTFQIVKPFYGLSVLDNVLIGVVSRTHDRKIARARAMELLNFAGLLNKREYQISELTIADRKKLELSRALATQPKILLLDEVMAALNPKETQDMMNLVRQIRSFGVTTLLIEHVMSVVMQLSDKIIVLDQGEKIAEGVPSEIAKNERTIRAYLGKSYEIT